MNTKIPSPLCLVQCCQQAASEEQAASTAPSRHPPSPGRTHPMATTTQNLGRRVQAKVGRLGSTGSRAGGRAHPSPRSKQMQQGAMGPSRPSKSILPVCCNHSKVYLTSGTHKKQDLKQNQTGLLLHSPNCGESLRSSYAVPELGLVSPLCRQGRGGGGGRKSPPAALCFPPPPLEDCRRPILIKLIKPALFKEFQPHATRGEEENIKLERKRRNLPASTLLQSHPSPADP